MLLTFFFQDEVIYEDLCAFKKDESSKLVCEFVPQEKRDYCLKELVETEAKYLEVLNMLKKHFINSPRLNPLKENDRAAIFMNIPQLIDLHQLFHSQIVDYVSKHIQGQRKVPLGAIFLEQKKQFLIYSHYCCALPKGNKPCPRNQLLDVVDGNLHFLHKCQCQIYFFQGLPPFG